MCSNDPTINFSTVTNLLLQIKQVTSKQSHDGCLCAGIELSKSIILLLLSWYSVDSVASAVVLTSSCKSLEMSASESCGAVLPFIGVDVTGIVVPLIGVDVTGILSVVGAEHSRSHCTPTCYTSINSV